jgi:hypothetical protein
MGKWKTKLVSIIDSTLTNLAVSVAVTLLCNAAHLVKGLLSDYFRGNVLAASGFILIFTFLLFDVLKRNLCYYTVYLVKNEIRRVYDAYHYTMTFVRPEFIRCTIQFTFRSLRCSMDCDSFLFKWQGSGYQISANGLNLEKIRNKNGFEEYLLLFPRMMKRNESIEVKLDIELYDEMHTAIPEMQFNVNHPTKNLLMELNIPAEIELDYVTKQCLVGNSDYAVQSESCDVTKRQFVIQKKKPLFLHKYKFAWQFSK